MGDQNQVGGNGKKIIMAEGDLRIETACQILDQKFQEELWSLLEKAKTFTDLLSPWRQNLNHDEFIERVRHQDTLLFLMYEGDQLIGFTFNTNNLELAPWLNLKFFKHNCPRLFEQRLIWCNIGMTIRLDKQKGGYLKKLLTETYHFGTSEGRIMIVDHSWRMLGLRNLAKLMVKFGSLRKNRNFQFRIYEMQIFTVFWVLDEINTKDDLDGLLVEKPLFET